MRRYTRTVGVVLAALLGLAPVVAPMPTAAAGGGSGYCAWSFVMEPAHNVIWPETNAIFWTTPYILFPGSELIVTGSFPEARYMSVKTYGFATNTDSLNDQQIIADDGSENPFNVRDVSDDPDARRYTIRVRPGAAVEEGDNELAAFENSGEFGLGFLNYRVYVPDDPTNLAGGTLPDVTISFFGGLIEKKLPTCAGAVPDPVESTPPPGVENLPSVPGDGSITPIDFKLNTAEHLFPNPDDAYLVGGTEYKRGHVAVVRAKGAAFPDTRAGAHVTDPHDLRYWSMCVHMLTFPLPTADCAGDFETVLDADGYYTYVISLPNERPENADAEHGVTWLPWGRPDVDVALTLRNMLPDPGFDQAIQDIVEPDTEATVMGDYYPRASLCDSAVFAAGGPDACLAES